MSKKIKNPEKYIRKLKLRIRKLERNIWDELQVRRRYAGTCYVGWADQVETKETCLSQGLGAFRVGNYVAVVGKVVEVHEDQNGSMIRFKRIQTKKVEAI